MREREESASTKETARLVGGSLCAALYRLYVQRMQPSICRRRRRRVCSRYEARKSRALPRTSNLHALKCPIETAAAATKSAAAAKARDSLIVLILSLLPVSRLSWALALQRRILIYAVRERERRDSERAVFSSYGCSSRFTKRMLFGSSAVPKFSAVFICMQEKIVQYGGNYAARIVIFSPILFIRYNDLILYHLS